MVQNIKIKRNGRPKLFGASAEEILARKRFELKQMVVVRSFVDRVFADIQSIKQWR